MSEESWTDYTKSVGIDPILFRAVTQSVEETLSMGGARARCVGVSSVPSGQLGPITGLIGVHGQVSGFIALNASERFAIKTVGGLLQEEFPSLTAEVVDGIGELTNIVAGSVKARIAKSEWAFSQITVPSVVVGQGYRIAFGTAMQFLSATFEQDDPRAITLDDRLLNVSMSLTRLS